MIDNTAIQSAIYDTDEIDLDRMAREVERLREVRGTTELKPERSLREWLKPVGKVVRPSFGGKIEPIRKMLFDDGQDQFKCGRQ